MKEKNDNPWTPEEVILLKKLYPITPLIPQLLDHFPGRTRDSISGKARKLGLERGPIGKQPPLDLAPTDAAYLAGLVDCDGSISILRSTRRGRINLRPMVSVFNSNTKLLHWIIKTINSANHVSRCRRQHPNHKAVYEWKSQSVLDVARILRTIMPYLIIKRRQAEIVLEWCENKVPYKQYTERELEIKQMILKLNQRGVK